MSIYGEIGKTVRSLREEKGYSREWLALECDMDINHLAAIERGRANPTIDALLKIADGLGLEFRNPLVVPVRV